MISQNSIKYKQPKIAGDSMHIETYKDDNTSSNSKTDANCTKPFLGTNPTIPTNSPMYKRNINTGFSIYRIYKVLSKAHVPILCS
jgi:hypothetical protein